MTAMSRRAALSFSASVAAAVLVPATLKAACDAGNDAAIIRLCGQIIEAEDAIAALYETRLTIEEEERTEPELERLQDRRDALVARLDVLGQPSSMAAVVAVARAGLRLHLYRDTAGIRCADSDSHWMLISACEALTGEG